MVVGEHEPIQIVCGADQGSPERRPARQIADRDAFGGAQLLYLFLEIGVCRAELDVLPGQRRIGGHDLHRFAEVFAETGHQVRVAGDDGVHRLAQALRIKGTTHGDIELHRIQVVTAAPAAGVVQQALLQRR